MQPQAVSSQFLHEQAAEANYLFSKDGLNAAKE